MKQMLQRLFGRSAQPAGHGIRGRVHKLSIVAGGEVSIVIRCGLDEPRARQLTQGALVELFETLAGDAAPPSNIIKYEGRDAIPGTAPAVVAERGAQTITIGTPAEGGIEATVEPQPAHGVGLTEADAERMAGAVGFSATPDGRA